MGENAPLILVVEDADDVREAVRITLERNGFGVAQAADGHTALREFHRLRPAAVVLDVGLPKLDGWEVLERIRVMSETPVLMLTALGTERDKIRGLDGGADDYLVKPFGTAELVARVRRLCRSRRGQPDETPTSSFDDGPLHIDFVGHLVRQDGRSVSLTPIEFNLLAVLTRHKGQVLSSDQLLERAWLDPSGVGTEKVKFAVRRLRKAMGWDKARGPIETVPGFGYCYRGMGA